MRRDEAQPFGLRHAGALYRGLQRRLGAPGGLNSGGDGCGQGDTRAIEVAGSSAPPAMLRRRKRPRITLSLTRLRTMLLGFDSENWAMAAAAAVTGHFTDVRAL